MTNSAVAAILEQAGGSFSLQQVELDDLRPDEVLIRNEASGICHTDISAQALLTMPVILGHEGVGVVEKIGTGVIGVAPGDRVVASFGNCGCCSLCNRGKPYVCDHGVALNFNGTRLDGSHTASLKGEPISAAFFQQSSFSSHSISSERNLVKVSDQIAASNLAPLGCGIMTGAGAVLNSFKLGPGNSLVVFGVGAVGLSAVMAAKLVNAGAIIVVDINQARLQMAKELGATHTIDASTGEVAAQIMELCPRGVDFSLETTGVVQALNDAIDVLSMEGECGMVTVPHYGEKFDFTPFPVFVKAGKLRGIFFGSSVPRLFIPKLIDFHQRGLFPYDKLIKTYPFADINQAFDDVKNGLTIKPVLVMN
tara:strand:+ start:692 stop:1789 length:1098 start_codon:yes stop_codon:yes gene_type:complete